MFTSSIRQEAAALWRLAGPLLITQLGQQLLGSVDTAVVGRAGEVQLAAVGLGSTLYFSVAVLGFGWMLALDPLISQAVGAGEGRRARDLLWQGGYLGVLATVPLALLLWSFRAPAAMAVGVEASTAPDLAAYLGVRAFGLLPWLWLSACRSYLQAHSITRPLVIGVVAANVVNLPLSIALVFGDDALLRLGLPVLGLPAMGSAGAAWASVVATVVQLGFALESARRMHPAGEPAFRSPNRTWLLKAIRVGTPIGLALLVEVGSFSAAGVMAANLGTDVLSAHNVAVVWISTTFQFALAMGSATSVRVAAAIGRGDASGTRRAGLTGIGLAAVTMVLGAIAFLALPLPLAMVFTDSVAVARRAVPLLYVAAAFQISDGVQAVAAGALRGAGDTRFAMVANVIGHYAFGLPTAACLAFVVSMGAPGLWWGLSVGLTAVAIALTLRFRVISRRAIARL